MLEKRGLGSGATTALASAPALTCWRSAVLLRLAAPHPTPPAWHPEILASAGSPAHTILSTAVLEVAAQPAKQWLAGLYASQELAAAAAESPVVLVSCHPWSRTPGRAQTAEVFAPSRAQKRAGAALAMHPPAACAAVLASVPVCVIQPAGLQPASGAVSHARARGAGTSVPPLAAPGPSRPAAAPGRGCTVARIQAGAAGGERSNFPCP